MSYVDKSYTAVSQAMSDIKSGLLSEHATERMVKNDEIWLGYYRHALEIHEHRLDGNRIMRTKAVKPTWWQKIAGGS
ncbi:hypothetical protein GOL99_12215 [Sinorhizobium medicae]|nr:hypothetical protein [Sinorhizobium medicae]